MSVDEILTYLETHEDRVTASFDAEFGHQAYDAGGPRSVGADALLEWWHRTQGDVAEKSPVS